MINEPMDKELIQALRASGKVSDAVLATLAERLERLASDLAKNTGDTDQIRKKIEQIEHAIVGNEAMGQWGIAQLQRDTRTRLHRLERITAIGTGVILAGSLLWDSIKAKLFGTH